MPDEQFLAQPTIARYASSLEDLPAADREPRLQLLADLAAHVGRTPDEMVAEVFIANGRRLLPEKPAWMASA